MHQHPADIFLGKYVKELYEDLWQNRSASENYYAYEKNISFVNIPPGDTGVR